MEDLFKKFLYTGVGLVTLTAEKLQEAVDSLVGEGKISKDEGKKIVDDFFENTESRKDEFEEKMKSAANNVWDSLNIPSRSEIESLTKRIEELEAKLADKQAGEDTPEA